MFKDGKEVSVVSGVGREGKKEGWKLTSTDHLSSSRELGIYLALSSKLYLEIYLDFI